MTKQDMQIWNQLDHLFENNAWTNWLSAVQQLVNSDVRLDELAKSTKVLAELYSTAKGNKRKSAGYGLLSACCYVKMFRIAPAVALCDWLKSLPDSRGITDYLESEISRALCDSPTHPEPQAEVPECQTQIQSVEAIKAIRNSFRQEGAVDYPKATYPLFSELPKEEVVALLKKAGVKKLKPNQVLFHEGDQPTSFYLVAEGAISLASDSGFSKNFEEGEFFGELGVLGNMLRTATASAHQEATIIEFSKSLLVETFVQFPELERKILRFFYLRLFLNMVRQDPLFKRLTENEQLEFFYTFTPGFIKSGRKLFSEGDESHSFFYLLSGQWEVRRSDGPVVRQGPGNFVGERGFLTKRPRNASVVATMDCHYLQCDENMFRNFGRSFPAIELLLQKLSEERRDPTQTDPARFIG